MNLKQRFALLFTLFVSIILFISFSAIYLFYNDFMKSEFYNRIALEGNEVYNIFSKIENTDTKGTDELIRQIYEKHLYQEKLIITDKNRNVLFKMPDSVNVKVPVIDKSKFKNQQYVEFSDDNEMQHVVIYKPETASYIYVSGYNTTGFRKLKNLQLILTFVFLGSLLLTAIMSFLFVNEAIKPILSLSNQMQNTNVQNLAERIQIKSSNDEISTIASNFNAMLERLKNAFESQKSFVHLASHELRTPLAIMLSQTEATLNRDQSIEEYKKTLNSLKEDQIHLVNLTNSLLMISQNDQLSFLTDTSLLRLDELIDDCMLLAKKTYSDIVIDFSFEEILENQDDLIINGNDALLKSAFFNLIKNAYQYSSDKKLQIKLFTSEHEIFIKFQNTGPQLLQTEVQKMTVPFFRGENAINTKGFGLGLSIIHRILELHLGKLTYLSSNNDMNEFKVQLPKG